MNIPADLGEQISDQISTQTEKLTQTVGALADKIDTDEIRSKAESGVSDLLDATTTDGRKPRAGLLLALAGLVVAIFVARRILR